MFKIGDVVRWKSQAGGYTKTKTGTIAAIIPAGIMPLKIINQRPDMLNLSRRFDGLSRAEISYLVSVRSGKTEKSSPVLYWPPVKKLSLVNQNSPKGA